jgi:hypothetical protein
MKSLFIAFSLLFSSPSKEVVDYREMLHKAFYSEQLAEKYYEQTRHINTSSYAVLRGYKAMSEFVMIKHTFNPFGKLAHFNRGRKELDAALAVDPNNVELIFLRFATQVNAPFFLGYSSNIQSDKNVLYAYAIDTKENNDTDLKNKIVTFLLNSKHTSMAEKKVLKQLNKIQ